MVTTINVSTKRQVVLPKGFCDRKNIKPGTSLRVVEIAEGLYVSPVPEPSARELKQVIASAGTFNRPQTAAEEKMMDATIKEYRKARRRRR